MTTRPTSTRQRKLATIVAAGALAAAGVACGGDDSGGGSGPQAQLAAELIAESSADGMDVDESCVRRVTSELSNDDARALLEDDDEALSMEGAMQLFALFECFDFDLGDLGDIDLDDLFDD